MKPSQGWELQYSTEGATTFLTPGGYFYSGGFYYGFTLAGQHSIARNFRNIYAFLRQRAMGNSMAVGGVRDWKMFRTND